MSSKTLYFLRHAKALSGSLTLEDHERPLHERGVKDAKRVGEYMREQGIEPSLALCSTALRTRQTLQWVETALGQPLNVRYESKLYLASPEDILSMIASVAPEEQRLMVVGHNPTLHQLCYELARDDDSALRDALAERFPTCALAEFDFSGEEWGDVSPPTLQLRRFAVPSGVEFAE